MIVKINILRAVFLNEYVQLLKVEKNIKKSEKNEKKYLTKVSKGGILTKLSARAGGNGP